MLRGIVGRLRESWEHGNASYGDMNLMSLGSSGVGNMVLCERWATAPASLSAAGIISGQCGRNQLGLH